MFLHSVDYADASKYNVDVLVSTESDIVKEICDENGVMYISRSTDLCGDVEVVDVYLDVINKCTKQYDLVVCPNQTTQIGHIHSMNVYST